MYTLTRQRYDGAKQINQVIAESSDIKDLKKIWANLSKTSCYIDSNNDEWYLFIDENLDDMEIERKTEIIHLRVSAAQKKMIKESADKLGLNVSAYLIMLSMKDNQ